MKKLIRDTLLEQLQTLPALQNVAIGRRHKWNADQLPAAVIFTDREESERISFSPIKIVNTIALVVRLDLRANGVSSGEDLADELLAAIDGAVLPTVAAIEGVHDIVQESIEFTGDGETDADYIQAVRTYQLRIIVTA